ncbi:MAG TPA: efflux RND transporter periplasmic adaptor subunit, partial [Fibrobacteria bacterium]|nr:efflux RND transporter periplasmic adaptor subunit [Fibrobacteria bacterium]
MMHRGLSHAVAVVAAATVAGGLAWWWRGTTASMANPSREAAGKKAEAPAQTMYNCPMHPWIIKDKPGACPICGMTLVPMKDHGHGAPMEAGRDAIRIDPAVIQNMGVKTEEVRVRELSKVVRLSGKLAEDETRQVSVNARIMGWVESLHADYLGKPVKAGETLMDLYSPDLLATQEEFLQALRYSRSLPESATQETRQSAKDLVQSARRRLEYWDIPASAIDRLVKDGQVRRTMPIVSPATGVVVAKNVVQGQNIMAGMELLRIADLSRIWALGEIYQEDLPYVKVGQDANVKISYLPGKSFPGKVAFIAPVLDRLSKTTLVRVELRNTPDLLLKPEMVADVELSFPIGSNLAVPEQAIIRTGRRNVAIVSLGHGYFEPRDVTLGASAGEYVQVTGGLKEGDLLVISSQFLIDSESNLKSAVMGMGQHNHGAAPGLDPSAEKSKGAEAAGGTHAGHDSVDTPKEFRQGLGLVYEAYLPLQA